MRLTLFILLATGPVGAIDVLYFHIWKFRLYTRPQSAKEQVAHLVRDLVAPSIFTFLLIGRPEGACFWFVAALFAADTINSLIDTMLEPASRAPIGVPPAELALHFIGASAMGAAWATFMMSGWVTRNAPAVLRPDTGLPRAIVLLAWSGVAIAFAILLLETTLFVRPRLGGRRARPSPVAPDQISDSRGPGAH
ncbi:MAG: hypothetical protein ACRD3J_08045 [Thermoanaerobaculia bacterium]